MKRADRLASFLSLRAPQRKVTPLPASSRVEEKVMDMDMEMQPQKAEECPEVDIDLASLPPSLHTKIPSLKPSFILRMLSLDQESIGWMVTTTTTTMTSKSNSLTMSPWTCGRCSYINVDFQNHSCAICGDTNTRITPATEMEMETETAMPAFVTQQVSFRSPALTPTSPRQTLSFKKSQRRMSTSHYSYDCEWNSTLRSLDEDELFIEENVEEESQTFSNTCSQTKMTTTMLSTTAPSNVTCSMTTTTAQRCNSSSASTFNSRASHCNDDHNSILSHAAVCSSLDGKSPGISISAPRPSLPIESPFENDSKDLERVRTVIDLPYRSTSDQSMITQYPSSIHRKKKEIHYLPDKGSYTQYDLHHDPLLYLHHLQEDKNISTTQKIQKMSHIRTPTRMTISTTNRPNTSMSYTSNNDINCRKLNSTQGDDLPCSESTKIQCPTTSLSCTEYLYYPKRCFLIITVVIVGAIIFLLTIL